MSVNFKSVVSTLIETLLKKSTANVSPEKVFSSVHITTNGQQVTSPIDGFANVNVGQKNSSDAYLRISSPTISHLHESITTGYYSSLHIPVKKGSKLTVAYSGFSNSPYVEFITRVGGGLIKLFKAEVNYAFA